MQSIRGLLQPQPCRVQPPEHGLPVPVADLFQPLAARLDPLVLVLPPAVLEVLSLAPILRQRVAPLRYRQFAAIVVKFRVDPDIHPIRKADQV